MDGDYFRATVGFVIPASGSSVGEVDFAVLAVTRNGSATELSRTYDTGRDGVMRTLDIDLTRVRGIARSGYERSRSNRRTGLGSLDE